VHLSSTLQNNEIQPKMFSCFWSNTLKFTPIVCDPSLTLTQFCARLKTVLFCRAYDTLTQIHLLTYVAIVTCARMLLLQKIAWLAIVNECNATDVQISTAAVSIQGPGARFWPASSAWTCSKIDHRQGSCNRNSLGSVGWRKGKYSNIVILSILQIKSSFWPNIVSRRHLFRWRVLKILWQAAVRVRATNAGLWMMHFACVYFSFFCAPYVFSLFYVSSFMLPFLV